MKLYQNQLWSKGSDRYRIVELERLSVRYKQLDITHDDGGTHHTVTKKEFCRLIKGAKEGEPDPFAEPEPSQSDASQPSQQEASQPPLPG